MTHSPTHAVAQALAGTVAGDPIEFGGLIVTPLVGRDEPAGDYLTLDEAIAGGLVEITEVSEAGRVPELQVGNRAAVPVLIVDGEELVGAKQNRVLNVSVLVAAQHGTTIPVSCVEAGRWRRQTGRFATSSQAQFASGRAEKVVQVSASLRSAGTRRSDQGAVWEAIAMKAMRMAAESDTHAMTEIFDRHAETLETYVERLAAREGQRGAVFSVHGRAAGIELFDRADAYRRLAPKIVRSYAIDAMERPSGASASTSVAELMASVAAAAGQAFPAVGEGVEVRIESDAIAGAALVREGRLVHLAAFAKAGQAPA